MGLKTGVLLRGRYEIVREIRRGGMGCVCEARDTSLANSPCAIKEILDSALTDPDGDYICATFEKEMRALVELDHPCIPKVRDFFQDGQRQYIVMEFVRGSSLEDEIIEAGETTGRGLPPGKAVADCLLLLETVAYLHHLKPPILHRDIKPANIIRDEKSGRIKLVDFGLAREVRETISPQTMVGTLGYCSPEQMSGKAELRSDIYSVGASLYHMLTGQVPKMTFEPLQINLPGLRPGLDRIVAKATEVRPQDRYNRAEEMAADLRVWQSGGTLVEPTETVQPRPINAPPPADNANPQWAWAFLVVLALGMGLAGGKLLHSPAPTATPSELRSGAPLASPTLAPVSSATEAPPSAPPQPSPQQVAHPQRRPHGPSPRPSVAATARPAPARPAPVSSQPSIGDENHYPSATARAHHTPSSHPPTAHSIQRSSTSEYTVSRSGRVISYSRASNGITERIDISPARPADRVVHLAPAERARFAEQLNSRSELHEDWKLSEPLGLPPRFLPMRGDQVMGGMAVMRRQVVKVTVRPVPNTPYNWEPLKLKLLEIREQN